MRRVILGLASLALGLVAARGAAAAPAAASGQDHRFSAAYQACIDHSGYVTGALAACEADENARLDAELNQLYRKLYAKVEGKEKLDLQKAERAWIAYKEAECAYEASGEEGGSDWQSFLDGCHKEMTYNRVQDLRRLLQN